MNLNAILNAVERRKNPKRRGRGEGSGLGKSAGRGNKGAKARSGWRRRYGYEGGQMPIVRRVPKRGFSNFNFASYFDVINVGELEQAFDAGATVDLKVLAEKGLLKPRHGQLKVLGDGVLAKKITVVAHTASAEARKKIEAAGGTLTCLIPPRVYKPRPRPDLKAAAASPSKGKKAEKGAAAPEGGAEKKDAAPKEKKEKGPKGGGEKAGEPAGGPGKEAKGQGPEAKDAAKKAGKKGEAKS